MSFENIQDFVFQLWSCETEEEVIHLLKKMSQSKNSKVNIQKPILLDTNQLNDNSVNRNSMMINCWINGVWKELDLNDLSTEFKKFNSKKIN